MAFVLVNGLFLSLVVVILYAPLKIVSVPLRAMYYENAVFEWGDAEKGREQDSKESVLHI